MRRILIVALAVAVASTVGCGGGESKMADKPTAEDIKAVEKAEKQVEDEERGTPVKGKGKNPR